MIVKIVNMARRIRRMLYAPPLSSNAEIRLHLGCGNDYWPGYVNIDIDPNSACDVQMDIMRIGENYPANSVTEISLIHSLSYLRLWQARDLFATLYQILKPGGFVVIEFPDVSKCARKALESKEARTEYMEAVRGLYAFDMEQIARKEMFIPYAFGWSGWHLEQELKEAGFRKIAISDPTTHGQRLWRDTRVEAFKE